MSLKPKKLKESKEEGKNYVHAVSKKPRRTNKPAIHKQVNGQRYFLSLFDQRNYEEARNYCKTHGSSMGYKTHIHEYKNLDGTTRWAVYLRATEEKKKQDRKKRANRHVRFLRGK